ncbi:PAC2 family protein, partial [Chryseobacterium sp. SIMBA_028]
VPDSNVDVVFVLGTEPSYRWRAYTTELLVHAEALKVDSVILVGALLADVPHSRPIPVSTTSEDGELRERLNLEAPQYEG